MDLESQRLNLLASIHEIEQSGAQEAVRLLKLKLEYNQVVETLRYQQHGSTPLDPLVKFPPEIWIPIIQQAIYRTPGVDRVPSMATLGSCVFVSRRWNKYITAVPVLWSNIDLNDSDNSGQDTAVLLATFLHFSQACELNISIAIPFASWDLVRDRTAIHRSRIKSIKFYLLSNFFGMTWNYQYFCKPNDILRFLSPLSHLTRVEGLLGDSKWLLEEGTPLAYTDSTFRSLDTLSSPTSRTLRRVKTSSDIQSVIPLMRNLQLARDVSFYGTNNYPTTNTPFIEPRDIDFEGLSTLNWVSLTYLPQHVHFPVWLLTRLPNLVDLKLSLWSIQLIPFLSTPPSDVSSETMVPCPSLRSFGIYDISDTPEYTMEHLERTFTLLVKIFSNVSHLTIRGLEFSSAYMSIRSDGFQKLEILRVLDDSPRDTSPSLLQGEACFPPSLYKLSIYHPEFMFSQLQSPTIEYLDVSLSHSDNIGQELSLSGWPKLRNLTINIYNVVLKNEIHQNLQEICLWSSLGLPNDSFSAFCCDVALYPSNLPSLQSIALDQLPEWDIFFLMLERKNFCGWPGVARIDRVQLRGAYPQRFLKPIRNLLSGIYTERPSNLDLSTVGNADIIFDSSIPGCIECHRALRSCNLEWDTPRGLDELGASLPSYPNESHSILLMWDERAAWWRDVIGSRFGRKESCSKVRKSHLEWIVCHD